MPRWPASPGEVRARLRFKLRASGVESVARLTAWLLAALLAHTVGAVADLFVSDALRSRRREERLRTSTLRLVGTLGALKGAFVKAGQFASLRHDVVPETLRETLTPLLDHVPPVDFEQVRTIVESELQRPLGQAFEHFERVPIAAASIAQVHRARLADGSSVAVKIQYPWIRASLRADLAILRGALGLWARFVRGGGGIDIDQLYGEFARGLAEELDFEHEARVAAEIAANLADDPLVLVPRVVPSHSSSRVLSMSYHEGVSIGDHAGLRELGVEPAAVLEVVARAYAKQIFVDGLFHADPHPGNLFVVRETPTSQRPRILFVDFGLSRRLAPDLRLELRRGICALLQRDLGGFLAGMGAMGMIAPGAESGVRAATSEMFERIAADAGSANALGLSGPQILSLREEAKRLLRETPGLQLPNDLLLYAKTLSYLFSLGRNLAPSVDLMRISLPYLLRFLSEDASPAPGRSRQASA